mmetsp:Transcript_15223/g.37380  ORF Transcript_15223/g.37380 Transcript_15223/m.37380 type:complete len:112 (+) Transcript_15223:1523-1858(+)
MMPWIAEPKPLWPLLSWKKSKEKAVVSCNRHQIVVASLKCQMRKPGNVSRSISETIDELQGSSIDPQIEFHVVVRVVLPAENCIMRIDRIQNNNTALTLLGINGRTSASAM